MAVGKKYQIKFTGVNPMVPPHLLPDDEVQTATNVDFGLIVGALVPRQGCVLNTSIGTSQISVIFCNYNNDATIGDGAMYLADVGGTAYRRTLTAGVPGAATNIGTGFSTDGGFPASIGAYKQYALIHNGTNPIKDDGTTATEWVKQSPIAPTVTVNTLTSLVLTGTYSNGNGTLIATSSNTATFSTDETCTAAVVFNFTTSSDLSKNGTHTLGNFGVHFINVAFSDPNAVAKVSLDYSVGGTTFANFWHVELNPQKGGVLVSKNNATSLINAQLTVGTNTSSTITSDEKLAIWSQLSQYNFNPLSFTPSVADSLAPWAITIPQFGLVAQNAGGTSGANLWTDIRALRLSVVCTSTCTVTCADPQVYGCEDFPLTDIQSGYYYWQTWATTNTDGLKIDESAPSPPAGPFTMQNAQAKLVNTGTATGTKHGINAVITYRQGGYMQDAYAINTSSYGVSTITDTQNDIDALSNNFVMPRGLRAASQFNGFSPSPAAVMGDRVFLAFQGNNIMWSLPGQIGSFPLNSFQEVSRKGDDIQGIVSWNPGLVIVNRSSVYEMYGTDFEAGQYTLSRSGSRKGSLAVKTCIRTPYGIPLINNDGLSMYVPGYNQDQDIPWFMSKYGDIFRGSQNTDPAAWKGSRVPALNLGSIQNCLATFRETKLYLAMPTGSSTVPNTVFVLDFVLKQCWWFTYPFNITSLHADPRTRLVWAGTDDGKIMVVEYSTSDQNSSGAAQAIVWSARTKEWTTPTDSILENLAADSVGTNIQLKGYYDYSTNPTIATLTNSVREWNTPPLNGRFNNHVSFDVLGTSSNTTTAGTLNALYEIGFELLDEPMRVRYWRTEHDEHNWTADKLWDVAYFDLDQTTALTTNTSTVTAVTFVDNVAVMTNTLTSTTSGRSVQMTAFPPEIYGRVAYTTYTATNTTMEFKHWETRYDARNEPAKVNYWRTDIESLEENIIDAFDTDINPNGTVLATVYVDNVAIKTATLVGTNRQSMTTDLPASTYPVNLYGRTLYVAYTGTGLKHYQTWFHKRLEPDRWNQYISPKVTGDEREIKVFKPEINCLGQTVLATTFLNGTAVSTHTITGTERIQYTLSLPVEKYARTVHAAYGVVGTGRFKHYTTEFEGPVEPPRVTLFRTGPYPYKSDHFLKTWQPLLDPINGTVTGTLIVEDVVMKTATFTGNRRQWFTVGIDLDPVNDFILNTGSRWECVYSGSAQFKHYETRMESDIDPVRKLYWSFHYKKIGGATQLDLARYWSVFCDLDDTYQDGPAVATYWWDIDGVNFNTGTLTLGSGHTFNDRIAFPPGARGRLFEFRFYAPNTIKIHNVNMDLAEVGVKNLTRRGNQGTIPGGQGSDPQPYN